MVSATKSKMHWLFLQANGNEGDGVSHRSFERILAVCIWMQNVQTHANIAVIDNILCHHTGKGIAQLCPAQQDPVFPVWPSQSKQILKALTAATQTLIL